MHQCWLCGSSDLTCVKPASLPATLDANAFRVTDASYGQCAAVDRCNACGFRQCSDFADVLGFYQEMDDPDYEATRGPRALQADRLLRAVQRHRPGGTMLDIGAGSGIMVDAANRAGYHAQGVEPSGWMVRQAVGHGLDVREGVLPMAALPGPYDVVTLVDVIEHVSDPVDLLVQARAVMAPDGIGMVVTPDVGSAVARAMGPRWWHYRLAHINYFDRTTIAAALAKAGLAPVATFSPSWYFTAAYLVERLGTYLPPLAKVRVAALDRVTVPLNLFDSVAVVFRRAEGVHAIR